MQLVNLVPEGTPGRARRRWLIVGVLTALLLTPAPVWAEDEPSGGDPAPLPEGAVLATVRGTNLNVRVGPRRDNNSVTQLQRGTVVIIIERIGDWAGILVPAGLPASLSGKYTERVGEDGVRIKARQLNLRVSPPDKEGALSGAFRDRVHAGDVLPFVSAQDDWYWIVAPEHVRAYVHAKYLEILGPPSEHADVLRQARAERTELIQSMVNSRKRLRVLKASLALRRAIGEAQQALYRLRLAGGHDRKPVARVADALAAAQAANPLAAAGPVKIATTLRSDLEAEIALRLAREDAETAKLRGQTPLPEVPLTPKVGAVEVTGLIRWEAAPRWKSGGAFILWIEGEPKYVLRLTTGVPGPPPDLKGSADGKPRTITARQPGTRVFGLPALDVLSLKR